MVTMLSSPKLRCLLVAGGLLVGLCDHSAAQSQPTLRDFAVLGLEGVRVGPGARVQPGAVGASTGNVRLAAGAVVPGSVVADSVHVSRGTRVGRLYCRIVAGGRFGSGTVGGPTVGGAPIPGCRALTTPIVDPALLAPIPVTPGSDELRIPDVTGPAPIAPGAFGAVSVGRGSLLQLAGGDYQVQSIRLARTARLVCLEECRIGVAESVRLGARAQLGAAGGLAPTRVRVDIAGADVDGVAFRAGAKAVVAGTIFAPGGQVVIGPRGDYRGAYVGRSVAVRPRTRVREATAFPPPP
jgi:hypothetical protein